MKPLSGFKVLDFTRFYAGPFCTMLLGDLGADVVKVEQPGGDPTRRQGPPFHAGESMAFLAANRNKRSIVIDLADAKGRETALALAAQADVLVENFRPGVIDRLGLGYETLAKLNPKLVYLSISGMGADGPSSSKGGFDLTAQAEGGYMSITGERGGVPIKLGTSAFDLVTAQYGSSAVLAALLNRSRTGRGERIETSLFESQITFLVDAAMEFLLHGLVRDKWGSEHAGQAPYRAFRAADGWIIIGAGFQNLFESACRALKREDLISDPRFVTLADRVVNREAINDLFQQEVQKWPVEQLLATLERVKVPCAPVNDVSQVFTHPQAIHRGMLQHVEHPTYGRLPVVGPAVKYQSFDIVNEWRAPPLTGEHSAEVLSDWLSTTTQHANNESREVVR